MRGVSGLAVGLAGAGGLLLYTGIRGVSVPEAMRSLVTNGTLPAGSGGAGGLRELTGGPLNGRVPTAATGGAAAGALDAGGSGFGQQFATDAASYAGRVPYRWGGATPAGWDCSGFPTYVLVHDLGRTNLPSLSHTVCTEYMVWSGAQTIDGPEPGALVLWPTHMGIALDGERMVSAVNPSRGTVIDTFAGAGAVPYTTPMFRRVL